MSFDALRLARPGIIAMQAYQSARSQKAAATGCLYLDANEFSEGSEPPGQATGLSRYPDPQPASLVEFLTSRLEVARESLFLGAGVDDAIDALVRVFCEAGQDSIMITPPTYGYYGVAAGVQGAKIISAPLQAESFALDEAAIMDRLEPTTKLIFICTPNNPTGNGFAPERIMALSDQVGSRALLVVDEAYIEFSGRKSLVSTAARGGNMVVLRTLSKAWGLAGARLGAAVGDPTVVKLMHKVRAPYPISKPAELAVMNELQRLTPEVLQARIDAVDSARDILAVELAQLPLVSKVYPSEANFLLIRTTSAAEIMRRCAAAGIIIRDRSSEPGLADCVRITVGAPAENAALLRALRQE